MSVIPFSKFLSSLSCPVELAKYIYVYILPFGLIVFIGLDRSFMGTVYCVKYLL